MNPPQIHARFVGGPLHGRDYRGPVVHVLTCVDPTAPIEAVAPGTHTMPARPTCTYRLEDGQHSDGWCAYRHVPDAAACEEAT
ncbi:hypothetical protein [Embleya sp. NPDC020630]|uniref:hypothetical protein n=1 Tax=Embleya sp. NPDC020630 TaxID=3363979 RepID=UPI00378A7EE9